MVGAGQLHPGHIAQANQVAIVTALDDHIAEIIRRNITALYTHNKVTLQ